MELFEALTGMRAMKRLRRDPVPRELLEQAIEIATHAPSGISAYNIRYVVVQEPAAKLEIGRRYREAWERYLGMTPAGPPPGQTEEMVERGNRATTWQANHLHEAPALILVYMAGARPLLEHPVYARAVNGQAWVAVQSLMLALRGLGLGAAITTLHLSFEREIDELLGVPEDAAGFVMIPVGYPMGRFGPARGVPIDHAIRWDRW
jgi:nitroreductase